MTATTTEEAVRLARGWLDDTVSPCGEDADRVATALLALADENKRLCEGVSALTNAMQHSVDVVRQLRAAQSSGGQQCGTGGEFASAPPSMLGRIEWYVRALREVTSLPQGPVTK